MILKLALERNSLLQAVVVRRRELLETDKAVIQVEHSLHPGVISVVGLEEGWPVLSFVRILGKVVHEEVRNYIQNVHPNIQFQPPHFHIDYLGSIGACFYVDFEVG